MRATTDPQSRIRKDCASFPVPPVQSGGPKTRHFRLPAVTRASCRTDIPELITYRIRATGGSIDVRSQCCWSTLAGSGYLEAPAPADAERRLLTVMFCDLVGSTEL